MARWDYDSEQDAGQFLVDGDLTISDVAALKEQLVEAFDQAAAVTIDVSMSPAVDIAGLQLLCAAHRYAAGRQRQMKLQVGENLPFLDLLSQAGLKRNFPCDFVESETCLWGDEESPCEP